MKQAVKDWWSAVLHALTEPETYFWAAIYLIAVGYVGLMAWAIYG